jgi:hypothetical protein
MSHLRNRILKQGRAVNTNAHLGKDYNAPLSRPLIRIAIRPGGVSYMQSEQLFTPDGRLVPETGPGTWGQLFKAGTP